MHVCVNVNEYLGFVSVSFHYAPNHLMYFLCFQYKTPHIPLHSIGDFPCMYTDPFLDLQTSMTYLCFRGCLPCLECSAHSPACCLASSSLSCKTEPTDSLPWQDSHTSSTPLHLVSVFPQHQYFLHCRWSHFHYKILNDLMKPAFKEDCLAKGEGKLGTSRSHRGNCAEMVMKGL